MPSAVTVRAALSPVAERFLAKENLAEWPFDTEDHYYTYEDDEYVWNSFTVQRKARRMLEGGWGPIGMIHRRSRRGQGVFEFRLAFQNDGKRWGETWRWSKATRGELRMKLHTLD